MLSINLLPKKESKVSKIAVGYALIGLVIFSLGIFIFFYSQQLKDRIQTAEDTYNTLNTQLEALLAPATRQEEETVMAKYEQVKALLDELNMYKPYTVEIFTRVIGLLPETGYIRDIQFNRVDSTMNFIVQFNEYKDAGYLALRMQDEEWVHEVTLSSIQTSELTLNNRLTNEEVAAVDRFDATFSVVVDSSKWKTKVVDTEQDKAAKDAAQTTESENTDTTPKADTEQNANTDQNTNADGDAAGEGA